MNITRRKPKPHLLSVIHYTIHARIKRLECSCACDRPRARGKPRYLQYVFVKNVIARLQMIVRPRAFKLQRTKVGFFMYLLMVRARRPP